ncbi:unnamed protein product [Schistosoma intercalatum]|nr:unnamed protein product [Schistosoma intercalatum]CAH8599810.1 unnamed protein product [Schistosoma intercalatum]
MKKLFYFILIIFFLHLFLIKKSIEIHLKNTTQSLLSLNTDYITIMDYPIRMCGNEFLKNLKRVCSIRGIYTPINRLKRSSSSSTSSSSSSSEQYSNLERILQRQKRFDDLCTLYTIYEPDQVVTQCCCIGCNRKYLEQFCNPN